VVSYIRLVHVLCATMIKDKICHNILQHQKDKSINDSKSHYKTRRTIGICYNGINNIVSHLSIILECLGTYLVKSSPWLATGAHYCMNIWDNCSPHKLAQKIKLKIQSQQKKNPRKLLAKLKLAPSDNLMKQNFLKASPYYNRKRWLDNEYKRRRTARFR